MKTLAQAQAEFQRALTEGDDAILADILNSSKEQGRVLLGVYRNAYTGRLVEFVRNDYPQLAKSMPNEDFEAMARAYIGEHPSRTQNARWFASGLPEFLAGRKAAGEHPELADLARLERALADVFDAADGTRLTLEHLSVLNAQDWPGVSFTPHPATRRFDMTTNAGDIWRSLAEGDAPPAVARLGEPAQAIAFRPELSAKWRIMSYEEAMMWDLMAKGLEFGGLCEMVATYGGEEEAPLRAAGHLKGWIAAGMLSGPEDEEAATP